MPDEKSIERWSIVGMVKSISQRSDGRYVKWDDHLDALGEAEKARDQYREGWLLRGRQINEEGVEFRRRTEAAEEKLETLRSGLKAELVMLRAEAGEYGRRALRFKAGFDCPEARRFERLADDKRNSADRLQALLDASEDTGLKLSHHVMNTPSARAAGDDPATAAKDSEDTKKQSGGAS
jgi:hypothetical protein